MTSPVATASGRLNASGMVVLNRISEKIGASARPKNAVLMCVAKVSPLNQEYSRTPIDDGPDVQEVLPEQREAERQEQARDRRAGHLRAHLVVDETGA